MKIKFFVALAALALVAGSAAARPVIHGGQSLYCATREAGNPFSKYCDYMAWSKWRQRGAWDSTLDNACHFNPGFVPVGCWRG